MIILLYGPNAYARDEKARELIDSARVKYPHASFEVVFGDDESVYDAHDFLLGTGLFAGGKKILYIHGVSLFPQKEVWARACVAALHTDVLCIISENWQKQEHTEKETELLRGVDHKSQFFAPYTSSQATQILCSVAQTHGVTIDIPTATYLYTYAHMDMCGAIQEVDRLSLLTPSITLSVLRTLPEYTESIAVFDFARAITSSSTLARRLTLWEYMKLQRVDMYMIFGYLAKMAKKQDLITALARADILVKSGRLEIDQALEQVVLGIATNSPR